MRNNTEKIGERTEETSRILFFHLYKLTAIANVMMKCITFFNDAWWTVLWLSMSMSMSYFDVPPVLPMIIIIVGVGQHVAALINGIDLTIRICTKKEKWRWWNQIELVDSNQHSTASDERLNQCSSVIASRSRSSSLSLSLSLSSSLSHPIPLSVTDANVHGLLIGRESQLHPQ